MSAYVRPHLSLLHKEKNCMYYYSESRVRTAGRIACLALGASLLLCLAGCHSGQGPQVLPKKFPGAMAGAKAGTPSTPPAKP